MGCDELPLNSESPQHLPASGGVYSSALTGGYELEVRAPSLLPPEPHHHGFH